MTARAATMTGDTTPTPESLGTPVRYQGRPLGFTVEQMLPERRFAVGVDGELIGRLEFAEQYRRFWLAQTANEEPSLVAIPNIVEFVSSTRDQDGRMVPIGWDAKNDRPIEIPNRGTSFVLTPEEIAARDASSRERIELDLIKRLVRSGTLSAEQAMAQILGDEPARAETSDELESEPTEAPSDSAPAASAPEAPALSAMEKALLEFVGTGYATRKIIAEAEARFGMKEKQIRKLVASARTKLRGHRAGVGHAQESD